MSVCQEGKEYDTHIMGFDLCLLLSKLQYPFFLWPPLRDLLVGYFLLVPRH